jgi:hypothetical protein
MMEDETESETEILLSKPPPKPSRPKIWVRNLDRNILHSIFETESAAFYVPNWYQVLVWEFTMLEFIQKRFSDDEHVKNDFETGPLTLFLCATLLRSLTHDPLRIAAFCTWHSKVDPTLQPTGATGSSHS